MNRRTSLALAAAGALAAACAAMDSAECRAADWYEIGFRDALYGLQRQDNVYVHQCQVQGAAVDVARYAQGWQEGKYEFDTRDKGPIY
jgi:hypothetical protein